MPSTKKFIGILFLLVIPVFSFSQTVIVKKEKRTVMVKLLEQTRMKVNLSRAFRMGRGFIRGVMETRLKEDLKRD